MPQSLQIVFHGINRSPAVETAVTEKVEALRRFDNQLGACKVTVSQEGHQTMGAFTIRIDLMASRRSRRRTVNHSLNRYSRKEREAAGPFEEI